MQNLKKLAVSLIFTGLLCGNATSRADVADSLKTTLSAVSAAELPIKAAGLVADAAPADQEKVAISVVKAAIAINPASAPAVIGAIAKVAPGTAAAITAVAVALQPKQKDAIVKAATSAAPTYITQIVQAVNNQDNTSGLLAAKVRPPFVPGSERGQIQRNQTVVVQPGEGRVYSKP